MKAVRLFLIAATLGCLLAGCSKKEEPAPPTPAAKAEKPAAPLEGLTYIKGEPVTFEAGKVTVVEFWATWCPPCRKSIPHLTEIQEQFKDKGVTVIGISNEAGDVEKVKAFVADQGDKMGYTVAVDTQGKVGDGYMKAFDQRGIPTAFVVDGQGNVAWVGHPMGGLDEALGEALAKSSGQAVPAAKIEPAPTQPEPVEEIKPGQVGDKAAALDGLTMIKGEQPGAFEAGKFYIVEFWATWCGPCRTSIPHLTEVQKQYKDKGVTVIGISNEEDLEKVKAFVTEQGEKMDYTVAVDAGRKISNGYMKAYGQRGIPTAFIVDGKGAVAWVGHPMGDMETVLDGVIAGTFDAVAYAKAKAEKEAAQQELGKLFQKYVTDVTGGATIEDTRATAEEILEKGEQMSWNALAWQIMSLPDIDDANRDMETAMKAATKANTATNGENPMVLDTYALALSKTGKLEEAVAAQQKAVEMASDNERMQADMKIRLEQFQKELAGETKEIPVE